MYAHRWKIATSLLLLLAVCARPSSPQNGQAPQERDQKKQTKKESKSERAAAAAGLPAVLWRDPGDISSLDLTGGPGGHEKAPKAGDRFTFVKEDTNGTSTKFYVKDGSGVEWLVKVGEEVHAETAATRIVWAMGYFADADYYLPSIHVDDMTKLTHGKGHKKLTSDVREVRLKLQSSDGKSIGNWSWYDNPFIGTHEFNGLRVMMALINNWDLTEVNNKIYPTESEREFVVSDLGASFGKTGGPVTRSKGKADDYEHSKMILSTTPEFINFRIKSRPFPLLKPFERQNYAMRAKIETVAKKVPRADVQWISERLDQLSDQQIHDAFRAAGFTDKAVEEYAKALKARIAQLDAESGKPEVRASTGTAHQ